MPNGESYRVIRDKHHLLLLDRLKWVYTTSANLSGEEYDEVFAREKADVVIEPIKETKQASKIVRLGKESLKRIR